MDRKEFIKACGFACIGGTALAAVLQSCASGVYFAQFALENNRIAIRKSEFLSIDKERTVERKFVVVKSAAAAFPICLFKINDGEYSALLMQCTHKGCELQPRGEFLQCPCHGSEFNAKGVVQSPPAEKNLMSYNTTTDNVHVYIHM